MSLKPAETGIENVFTLKRPWDIKSLCKIIVVSRNDLCIGFCYSLMKNMSLFICIFCSEWAVLYIMLIRFDKMCALLIRSSWFHSRASPGKPKMSDTYENSLPYFPICLFKLPKPYHRSFIHNITNLHRPEQTTHHFARQSRTRTSCHLCCWNVLERNSINVIGQKPDGSPDVQNKTSCDVA